jgi:hypothetical protein
VNPILVKVAVVVAAAGAYAAAKYVGGAAGETLTIAAGGLIGWLLRPPGAGVPQ